MHSKGGHAKNNGTFVPWHFGQAPLGQRTPMTRAVPCRLAVMKACSLSLLSVQSASLGSFVVISAQSCLGVTTTELAPTEMHDTSQNSPVP